MISIFISFVIATMHNYFEIKCKEADDYIDFCIINYYVTGIIVLFILPYIYTKMNYNIANDRFYRASIYLFIFIIISYFL